MQTSMSLMLSRVVRLPKSIASLILLSLARVSFSLLMILCFSFFVSL